jgi:hypothetical protein
VLAWLLFVKLNIKEIARFRVHPSTGFTIRKEKVALLAGISFFAHAVREPA